MAGQPDDFLLSESTQQFPHFSAAPDIEAIRQLLTPGKTQQSIQRGQRIETDMVTFDQKCPVPCRTELGQRLQHIFPRAAQQLQ
ncbi:hypothetical protein [Klebsiella sp. JB_Kp009]|uniref:hypothetical protein n=1 Tax=Klebsiella sp. JB_Kp009 TaxID=3153362 RepID=UPI0032B3EE0C